MGRKKPSALRRLTKNILEVIGIIFIWRSTWILLDFIDAYLFDGIHTWTAILGVVIGLIILLFAKKAFFNAD